MLKKRLFCVMPVLLLAFPLFSQQAVDLSTVEKAADATVPDDAPELDIDAIVRQRIVAAARSCLGSPYVYGSAGPDGYDCSGFVYHVFSEAAGLPTPRSAKGLWKGGGEIALADVRPGDILVFATVGEGASHAGIVIENGADGIKFIHAASAGPQLGVIISSMKEKYYSKCFLGARRYITENQ